LIGKRYTKPVGRLTIGFNAFGNCVGRMKEVATSYNTAFTKLVKMKVI
jgi:hypothetical protein